MANDLDEIEPRTTEALRPRQRVSARRYLMRRIGAMVVFTLIVIGVIKVGAIVFGTGSTEAASGGLDTASTVDAVNPTSDTTLVDGGSTSSIVPAGSTGPTGSTTATGSTEPGDGGVSSGVPSAANPARLLIVGDSDAGAFAPYLNTLVDATGMVTTELDYKVSTGLSRPDYFDWPAHLAESLPAAAPDIIVVTFGGNDAQALTKPDGTVLLGVPTGTEGGDLEWRAEYGKRVGAMMDLLSADGRTLVWVGIPNGKEPGFTARLRVQDEVVRAELAKRPKVLFVDTWKRFSGVEGNYAEFVMDPRDGQGKDVRSDIDGFHLNTTGAEILALDIAEVVRGDLRARGATL